MAYSWVLRVEMSWYLRKLPPVASSTSNMAANPRPANLPFSLSVYELKPSATSNPSDTGSCNATGGSMMLLLFPLDEEFPDDDDVPSAFLAFLSSAFLPVPLVAFLWSLANLSSNAASSSSSFCLLSLRAPSSSSAAHLILITPIFVLCPLVLLLLLFRKQDEEPPTTKLPRHSDELDEALIPRRREGEEEVETETEDDEERRRKEGLCAAIWGYDACSSSAWIHHNGQTGARHICNNHHHPPFVADPKGWKKSFNNRVVKLRVLIQKPNWNYFSILH